MREPATRVLLGLLAAGSAVVGVWAQFFPASFHADFPAPGREWVAADGPFNEHLIRDVGGLNLALTVVTVAAALTLAPLLVRVAALAWLPYAIPHLVYHAAHLEPFGTADQVALVSTLAFTAVAPVVVLWLWRPGAGRANPEATAATDPGLTDP